MTRDNRLVQILTFAGAIPFVVAACLHFISHDSPFWPRAYAAIILSFLAGLHWAVAVVSGKSSINRWLLVSSNVVALVSWCSLLVPFAKISIIILVLGFGYQLWIDSMLAQRHVWPPAFWQVRQHVTMIVVGCLLVLLL